MRRWKSTWQNLNFGIFKPLMAVATAVRPLTKLCFRGQGRLKRIPRIPDAYALLKRGVPKFHLLRGRSPGSSVCFISLLFTLCLDYLPELGYPQPFPQSTGKGSYLCLQSVCNICAFSHVPRIHTRLV